MTGQILLLLEESVDGLTSKDLAILLRCPRATIARRLEELKVLDQVEGTGEYRADAAVVRATMQRSLAMA